MRKTEITAFFGSLPKAAKALGITRSAAYQWKDIIPERMAYRAQALTGGQLAVDPSVYIRKKEG